MSFLFFCVSEATVHALSWMRVTLMQGAFAMVVPNLVQIFILSGCLCCLHVTEEANSIGWDAQMVIAWIEGSQS